MKLSEVMREVWVQVPILDLNSNQSVPTRGAWVRRFRVAETLYLYDWKTAPLLDQPSDGESGSDTGGDADAELNGPVGR
jgi:hypothetical protein